MSKRKQQRIERVGTLRSRGWNLNTRQLNQIQHHSGKENPKHIMVKTLLGKAIKDNGHSYAMEIHHTDRGIADVIDLYESGPGAYIYEVETGCSDERRLEKAKQYTDGFDAGEITDVFVVDPTNAPDEIDECATWCKKKVVE